MTLDFFLQINFFIYIEHGVHYKVWDAVAQLLWWDDWEDYIVTLHILHAMYIVECLVYIIFTVHCVVFIVVTLHCWMGELKTGYWHNAHTVNSTVITTDTVQCTLLWLLHILYTTVILVDTVNYNDHYTHCTIQLSLQRLYTTVSSTQTVQ